MDGLTIGVYGIYLILVGFNGNAGELANKVQTDAPKFLPWIIAIFVIATLNGSSEAGRKITGPFVFLLALSFVLRRFDTLKDQSEQLWNMAANAGVSGATNTSNSGAGSSPQTFPSSMETDSNGNIKSFSDNLSALENLLG